MIPNDSKECVSTTNETHREKNCVCIDKARQKSHIYLSLIFCLSIGGRHNETTSKIDKDGKSSRTEIMKIYI